MTGSRAPPFPSFLPIIWFIYAFHVNKSSTCARYRIGDFSYNLICYNDALYILNAITLR